jgi:methanogenic corrinoid protein MtbC1
MTAIELDTLRMWERRYGFPRPERTEGGSRLYSDSDIESLKLIRRALELGYRPGEVVGKPHQELMQLVLATSHAPARATTTRGTATTAATPTVASLLGALGRDDVTILRAELRQAAVALGPKRFVMEVGHPLSVRVGELWADGKLEVRHEHMLSECLSAQLGVMMSAYEDREGAPRVLLATLPDERHRLGLAMVQVYLALSQVTPLMLGVDTPPDQIVKAGRTFGVDAVGLLVTQASDLAAASRHIRWMLAELPRKVGVWVGGRGAADLELPEDAFRVVATWADLDAAIATVGRRTP